MPATVRIQGDKSALDGALGESQRAFQTWGNNIRNIVRGVVGALALREGFQAIKGMVADAAEEEASIARLGAVLKATDVGATTEQIGELADEMMRLTRFGDDAVRAAATSLSAFGNIKGSTLEAAIRTSANLAELLGTDMPQAAEQLGRALQDPEAGLGRLSMRVGKLSTDQEKLIKSFLDAGQVAEAQGVILDHINNKTGDLAETIGRTTAGEWEQFKNQIGEVGEEIGSKLIKNLTGVGTSGRAAFDILKSAVTDWGNTWKMIVVSAELAITSFWENFKKMLDDLKVFGDGLSGSGLTLGGNAASTASRRALIDAGIIKERGITDPSPVARELTLREKQLQKMLDDMATKQQETLNEPGKGEGIIPEAPGFDFGVWLERNWNAKTLGPVFKDLFATDKESRERTQKAQEDTFKTSFSALTQLNKEIGSTRAKGFEENLVKGVGEVGTKVVETGKTTAGMIVAALEKVRETTAGVTTAVEQIAGFGLR